MPLEDDLAAQLTAMIAQGEYPADDASWIRQNFDAVIAAAAASRYGKMLDPTLDPHRPEVELRNALKAGIYVLHLHR